MREILTLSLPSKVKKMALANSRSKGFGSVSEYVKHLLVEDDDVISEKELFADIKAARREHRAGKCIDADSVSLMDIYYGKKN